MIYPVYKYTWTDRLIAVLLAAVILFLCLGSLHYGCEWGDDSAAYISEGIAIAEGSFKEHVKLTPMMHPSFLGDNVKDELVYVWGYPLLLSLVYRIHGFDTDNYSNIILYKLPSAVFLAIMTFCFFLLLRRRFSLGASVFVTCFFCSAPLFTALVNSLYSDMVYTGMCMLTLLVMELYLQEKDRKKLIVKGIILGVLMWYSMEVRTNGAVFIAVLLTAQIAEAVSSKRLQKENLLPILLPYAVLLVLKLVSEYVLLRPATVNSADMTTGTLEFIANNTLYYIISLFDFTCHLFSDLLASVLMWFFSAEKLERLVPALMTVSRALGGLSMAMAALGIFTDGLKRNQYLTLYLIGCAVGTCILSYNQGLRYMLGIMPVMALFSVYGYRWIYFMLCRGIPQMRKSRSGIGKAVIACLIAVLCAASCYVRVLEDADNIRRIKANGADIHANSVGMFSPEAIEVYNYIKENTPSDALFTFHKPRALYLNTGRLGFSYLVNDNDADDADYCILPELFYDTYTNGEAPEWFSDFEVVLRNSELTVMKKRT